MTLKYISREINQKTKQEPEILLLKKFAAFPAIGCFITCLDVEYTNGTQSRLFSGKDTLPKAQALVREALAFSVKCFYSLVPLPQACDAQESSGAGSLNREIRN